MVYYKAETRSPRRFEKVSLKLKNYNSFFKDVGIHYLYDKIIIMIICFIFRHIILIRHGQYNLDGKTDDQRYLTELGKEQVIKCSTIFLGKKKK